MHFSRIEDLNAAHRRIHSDDTVLVFGDGPVPCRIMLAGEAPGADEIRTGRPFTGMAGRNFQEFLEILDLTRNDVYIGNVCKFRPYKVSAKGTVSNRPPTRAEIRAAMPYFHEEIRLVAPELLITLGNTPLHAVTGDFDLKVSEVHGTCLSHEVPNLPDACLFALYHPASIIYSPGLRTVYEQDLQILKERVDDVLGRA